MMHYWDRLWDWNNLDSVRAVHNFFEVSALVFFGLLVVFDVLTHRSDRHPSRSRLFAGIGLWFFGAAVLAELIAYPFSRRNDTLADRRDAAQRDRIADLDNSTQVLKGDAEKANKQAAEFQAQIADAYARAKSAEAHVASSTAASNEAIAKVADAEARSAEASAKSENFRSEIASANESAKKAEAQVAGAVAEAAKANLELARLRTPRSLDSVQQSRIATVLRQFAGQQFSLLVNPDPESIAFLRVVRSVLKAAGWTEIPSQIGDVEVENAGIGYFSGLSIEVSPNEIEVLRGVTTSVAAAFIAEGVFAVSRTNVQLDGKTPRMINIGVGQKP